MPSGSDCSFEVRGRGSGGVWTLERELTALLPVVFLPSSKPNGVKVPLAIPAHLCDGRSRVDAEVVIHPLEALQADNFQPQRKFCDFNRCDPARHREKRRGSEAEARSSRRCHHAVEDQPSNLLSLSRRGTERRAGPGYKKVAAMDEEQQSVENEASDNEEVEVEKNGAETKSGRKRSPDGESDDKDDETELQPRGTRKTKGAEKKPKTKRGDDDNGIVWELSKNRMIAVQNFRGQVLVSIREYYEKNGAMLPGQKGISLTVEQWEALKEGVADVDAALAGLSSE